MKKVLFAIASVAILTFYSSCSIFVHTKHHGAGVTVGDNNTAPPDSLKTPVVNTSK